MKKAWSGSIVIAAVCCVVGISSYNMAYSLIFDDYLSIEDQKSVYGSCICWPGETWTGLDDCSDYATQCTILIPDSHDLCSTCPNAGFKFCSGTGPNNGCTPVTTEKCPEGTMGYCTTSPCDGSIGVGKKCAGNRPNCTEL